MTGAGRTPGERVVLAQVTDSAIDAETVASRVESDRAGAVATFAGVVRDHHDGKAVAYLEYEAYVPMAERVVRDVATEAAERWPLEAIAVSHRFGRLQIGEIAVMIAVSSPHRADAFDAVRYTIDELKRRVPIWKRETGPDGTFWIEGPEHVAARS
jgi:molybdopterin synthase catalytic subunit